MNSAWRLAIALSIVGFVQTACSVGGPTLKVQDAQIVQQTPDHVEFQIHLQAVNDTDSPMRLLEYTYSVNVDGHEAYTGRRAALATLAAKSTTDLTIPGVAPREALKASQAGPQADGHYSVSGTLTFVVPGTVSKVLYDAKLLRPAKGFEGGGELAGAGE